MLNEAIFRGRRLAIVGSICRDVKMGPLRPGPYLQEDGETPTAFITETIGGGGANSALAAAALGADVRFAGRVGADALGQRLEQSLVQHGVKAFLHRAADVVTGSSVVLSYENGCRHFVSCQPNNYGLQMSDIAPDLLAGAGLRPGGEILGSGAPALRPGGAGHLLRADVWFSEPMLAGGNAALLRAARNAGMATSLDINWDPQWGTADAAKIAQRRAAVRDILPLVDLVHGNIRELNRFAESNNLEITLRRITAWGAGAIVIHMGAEGAGYWDRNQLTVAPAVPVRQYQNTAGTGDLLSVCMMLLHECQDMGPRERLQLANTIVADYIEGRRAIIPDLA